MDSTYNVETKETELVLFQDNLLEDTLRILIRDVDFSAKQVKEGRRFTPSINRNQPSNTFSVLVTPN